MVGELELARLVLDRAGERAALEAEQLATRAARSGARAQFTLTNGLSRRSDDAWSARATSSLPVPLSPRISTVHVGVGDALDQLADLGHPLAVAEQHAVCRLRVQLLAQRGDFAASAGAARSALAERHFELGFVERLADEIGRAELHRLHDGRGAALAREHDDRHVAVDLLNAASASSPSISPGMTTSRMTAAGRSAW